MRQAIRRIWIRGWQGVFGWFGLAIVRQADLGVLDATLAGSRHYVTRSGHLHTVRGRTPHAVKHLDRALLRAEHILQEATWS